MAPKENGPQKKSTRGKSVMDIAQKMKIIQLLESGEKVAAVAKRFVAVAK